MTATRRLLYYCLLSIACTLSAHTQEEPELTDYMVELQVLTHKLGLSIEAGNLPLTEFYLHETQVKLLAIQTELPVYEGTPIALYIDRLLTPDMKSMTESLKIAKEAEAPSMDALDQQYDILIRSCNACHAASNRSEIRIARNSHNPYLQDFSLPKK